MAREVTIAEAREAQGRGALVVDVREHWEWARGHVPGALHIALDQLPARLANGGLPRGRTILFICASGNRSLLAADYAASRGHREVASVAGGTQAWAARGLPVER